MARISLVLVVVAVVVAVAANASIGRSSVGANRQLKNSPAQTRQFPFSFDYWVVVKWDGTLVSRSGVVSATRIRKGDYLVTFFRPVLNCAWLATVRTFTVGGDEPSAVGIKAATHYVGIAPNFTVDPRAVEVETFNDTGSSAGFADASFSLAVIC